MFAARHMQQEAYSSRLFDQEGFYDAFVADLKRARRLVIIESPFMTRRRVNVLLPILEKLVRHGVRIIVNTKPFDEHDLFLYEQSRLSITALQEIGVTVVCTVGHHRKIAIIDDQILWEGSLNILSQSDSCEVMRRIVSEQAVQEMRSFIKLDRFV